MLSRSSIRRVLKEDRGAISRVAKQLGITRGTVSRWLSGERPNQPEVEKACREEAERILRGERHG